MVGDISIGPGTNYIISGMLKMFSHVGMSLSLVHTLNQPVWLSFCKSFPENSTVDVDEKEVDQNYSNALSRHETMYND